MKIYVSSPLNQRKDLFGAQTDQRKDESNPLFGQVFPFQELNLKHENVKKRNTTDIFLMAKLVSLKALTRERIFSVKFSGTSIAKLVFSGLKRLDENNVTVTDQRKDIIPIAKLLFE